MIKKLILLAIIIIVAVIAIPIIIYMRLDTIVKSGIETIGPKATGTTVTVEQVSVSPFSLDAEMQGLTVGNPSGYKSEYALKMNKMAVDVDRSTVGGDVIRINKVDINGAEVNWDGIKGSNLMTIKENVLAFAEKIPGETEESEEESRLFIKEFSFRGGKLHVWIKDTKVITLTITDISLYDIGDPVNGSTPGEIIADIYPQLLGNFAALVSDNYNRIAAAAGDLWDQGKNIIEKGVDRLQRLFKK